MGDFKFIFDVLVIITGYFLLHKFRITLANILLKIPGNKILISLIVSIPFIMIEESINCIDWNDGQGCRMTGWINIVLFIQIFIILKIMHKYKTVRVFKPIMIYAIIGVSWEILAGGLSSIILHPFILFMGPYVGISYGFISIISITMMSEQNKLILQKNNIGKN